MVGSQKGSGTVRGPWTELARWRARRKSVGRNCVARRGKDSVGRVAADGKASARLFKGCRFKVGLEREEFGVIFGGSGKIGVFVGG